MVEQRTRNCCEIVGINHSPAGFPGKSMADEAASLERCKEAMGSPVGIVLHGAIQRL